MRWMALVVSLVVLSGCSSQPASGADDPVTGSGAADLTTAPSVLHFASGDFEGTTTFSGSFPPTETCTFLPTGCAARRAFDLTELVPPDAPVELTVTVQLPPNGYAYLELVDASASQGSDDYQSGQATLAAKLVRSSSGSVKLVVERDLPFDFPPNADPLPFSGEARSLVRAGSLPSYTPAAISLSAGDDIALVGEDIEALILIPPTGPTLRDDDEPYNITLPAGAPKGTYILFMEGAGTAQVQGPNVTMTAKRLTRTEGPPHDLVAGQVSWDFEATPAPLQIGMIVRTKSSAAGFAVVADAGPYEFVVNSPGNAPVLDGSDDCGPLPYCSFNVIGSSRRSYYSDFLDERLTAGTYSVQFSMQNPRDMEALEFMLQVL